MVDVSTQLLSAYQALLELYHKQIKLAEKSRYDQQLEEIFQLESQKCEQQILIQELRLNSSDYESVSVDTRNQLLQIIDESNRLNEKLQAIIKGWYGEDSISMKQINTQRKTLHSYGGYNSNEIISYYIDSKK